MQIFSPRQQIFHSELNPIFKTGKEETQQSSYFIVNNSVLLISEKMQTIKISSRERKQSLV